MEEKIIGYDVREMWVKYEYDFRMGSKLVKGLSNNLYNSIFNQGDYRDVVGKAREEKGFGIIELPPMMRVGTNYPLWSDLADMLNYLRPYHCAEGKPYWVVAITVRTEDLEGESRDKGDYPWPYDPESRPDRIQSDWTLVGYDLMTEWSEGMIVPKLFPEAEAADVAELTRELNEHLLFPSIEKAVEFKTRWDTAFPEYAPHLVYGTWRVQEARYRPTWANSGDIVLGSPFIRPVTPPSNFPVIPPSDAV